MVLSMVIPCFNEEENIRPFYEAVTGAFGDLMGRTELIFVNDGSGDRTMEKIRGLVKESPYCVKAVSFSRNFGKEAALLAGLRESTGEFTAVIDADLQQRPEYVLQMMEILEKNPDYDAVAAYQEERKESVLLRFFKKNFYRIINSMTEVEFVQAASDFRLLRRCVVEAILALPEKCRFSKGIFAWVGFNTCYIPYTVEERVHGSSKWNFWKLMAYAIDGIVAFSTKPLILASMLGVAICCLALILLIITLVKTLTFGDPVAGYPTLACLILGLSGIQLLCVGILGQYLAKNFIETKNRPSYIVRERLESAGKGKEGRAEEKSR